MLGVDARRGVEPARFLLRLAQGAGQALASLPAGEARLVFTSDKGERLETVTLFTRLKPFVAPPPPAPPAPPADWDHKVLARLTAALAAMGTEDQICPDEELKKLSRRQRVHLKTVSQDSLLLTVGKPGLGHGCEPGEKLTGELPGLILVDVAESCKKPTLVAGGSRFDSGLYRAVVALVDLKAGTILCHTRYSAANSAVAKGDRKFGAEGIVGGDFLIQIDDLRLAAIQKISRYIEAPVSGFDPQEIGENGRIY